MFIRSILAGTGLLIASVVPALAQVCSPTDPQCIRIPEPETLLLFGAGLAAAIAFGVIRRRK